MKEQQPQETGGAGPEAGERPREENAGPQEKSGKSNLRRWLLPCIAPIIAVILIGVPTWLYYLGKKKVQEQAPGEDTTESPAEGVPQGDKEGLEPLVLELSPPEPSKPEEEGEPPGQEEEGEPVTPEMHFILGLDAYKKGDLEEAAKHWEIAALSGKNPNAYFNWGNVLLDLAWMKKDEALFRESSEKYAEAVRLNPDYHEAYTNWSTALTGLARMKRDETLFREAMEKCAEAIRIKPDKHEAYSNWGNALSDLALMKGDEALFRESFGKYAEAVRIEPDSHFYYRNWGLALRACAKIAGDEAGREALLKEAGEKEKKAEELKAASKGTKWGVE
jgi:tetratricopeptide (TPR) repeat protein